MGQRKVVQDLTTTEILSKEKIFKDRKARLETNGSIEEGRFFRGLTGLGT